MSDTYSYFDRIDRVSAKRDEVRNYYSELDDANVISALYNRVAEGEVVAEDWEEDYQALEQDYQRDTKRAFFFGGVSAFLLMVVLAFLSGMFAPCPVVLPGEGSPIKILESDPEVQTDGDVAGEINFTLPLDDAAEPDE